MTQLSVRDQAIEHLDKGRERILTALPALIDKDRFYEIAVNLVRTNTDLSRCTPHSIAMAIYGCARLGLMPDPSLGHVYVVPFGEVATVVPGYMGFIELARRSGKIGAIHTELVYDGDDFDYYVDEHGPHIMHRPGWTTTSQVIGGYCVAQMTDGTTQIERMTIEEIEKRRTKSGIWTKWPKEQMRKTLVKSARKYWPLSPELAYAAQLDNQAEIGERQAISPQLDDVGHPPAADSGTDPLLQEAIGTAAGIGDENAEPPEGKA